MDRANTAILVALLICGLAAVSESLDDDIHAMMGVAASNIPNSLAHMKPGFEPHCGLGEIPCSDGMCLFGSWICDFIKDCGDFSDEKGCVCTADRTRCGSGECMNNYERCNGYEDCYDASDETGCEGSGRR